MKLSSDADSSPQQSRGVRRLRMTATVGLVGAYLLLAWYPFRLDMRRSYVNRATRLEDGTLRVVRPGIMHTVEPPPWIDDAIRLGAIRVELDVRPVRLDLRGPARILTLSIDKFLRNLLVGQQMDALAIQLRRPGSNLNGKPTFEVQGIFRVGEWSRIEVDARAPRLRVHVDGRLVLDEPLPEDPFRCWSRDYPLALGSDFTIYRSWAGDIRHAVIEVGGKRFDCLSDDSMKLPSNVVRTPWQYKNPIRLVTGWDDRPRYGDFAVNLFGFVPLGLLVVLAWRPRKPLLTAFAAGFGVSLTMELGQFIVARSPNILDLVMNSLGGLLGGATAVVLLLLVRARAGKKG